MIDINYLEVEERVRTVGRKMEFVLDRAGVTYRTWFNWKTKRIDPLERINKVLAEVEKLEKEFNGGNE